ncbi:hypothetical protein [Methylobacter sp.]|uniref:hypothetical protein n=1 Tax=Methylobacter sp. TaxID=2051955 RepID=UPI003DA54EBC
MAKKKKAAAYPKTSIKKDGYKMHYSDEVREMMEEHMHDAAKIKRHKPQEVSKGEGKDTSSTGSQRPRRKCVESDLNNRQRKPNDEPFSVEAEYDAIKAFKRAGGNKNTGADNDKESLEYSRKMKVGTKSKSNSKAKKRK